MEQFLDIFFFADKVPLWVSAAGSAWGIDMACLCALPNFFNLILHFIIGGFILIFISRYGVSRDLFFLLLLGGLVFSGTSKFIDWIQNMLTATGNTIFFNYSLDIITEILQFVGMAIIFFAIFRRLYGTTNPLS